MCVIFYVHSLVKAHHCHAFRCDDSLRALTVQRFRYYCDPLFLIGCAAYAINHWLVKPHVHTGFFHNHFDDCWLIPCALPLVLWSHRRLGLRRHDHPQLISEIVPHLVFWSLLFKCIGPKICSHATPDPWDVLCYWVGGSAAWLWWHRKSKLWRSPTA
jgi:hypothetical protein